MKRLITAVIIATGLALCAAVWPQAATVEETPMPTPAPAVTAPEPPATGVKFEAEIDPPTEKEKDETSQSESPHEPINEPKPEAVEALAAPEVQPRISSAGGWNSKQEVRIDVPALAQTRYRQVLFQNAQRGLLS